MSNVPWLLYTYAWMPYPRRISIYLREKNIPESLIRIIDCWDPATEGMLREENLPAKPAGSLPILAIPNHGGAEGHSDKGYTYIRQSVAIIKYIDEHCDQGILGFPKSEYSMAGESAIERARITEICALADDCLTGWNSVRTFGSAAGALEDPAASRQMMKWVKRSLQTIEQWWNDRDMQILRIGGGGQVNLGDILLFQFLQFTKEDYGVDMTKGTKTVVKDAYDREVLDDYPKLAEFYEAFGSRDSAMLDGDRGDVAPESVSKVMKTWWEGSLAESGALPV
ncbi:hypothetical protein B0A52_01650 [Exophiala mesophila]|uniref:GST N-terminal domain-containing protein n=1 Tax=Exophiala mesophila TaxID=212818 RepID=A0A438NFL5_EXOME|nr:hypothetical protein B0A52_01650 [Exophiala mesophila]